MKMKWYWKAAIIFAVIVVAIVAAIGAKYLIHKYQLEHTDIPKLYFTGDISEMEDKSDVRQISFKYVDDDQTIDGFAEIKVQGSSSLYYEKKNYTLKFFEDEALDNKLKIDMGWGPQNKYCMKANWIDSTHARNVVTAKLAAKVQNKYGLMTQAPNNGLIDGFPVEIFSNGEFLGLYTFNIPKDAWQFAMDEDNPDHIVICGEGWDDANLFNAEADFETWAVEVGEESPETLEKVNRLFNFVKDSTDEEFKEHFEEYLNLDSALNYYIMTDLAWMYDNRGKNMLIATYDGMEWYLSLYDLDTSWGTSWDGLKLNDYAGGLVDMQISNLFTRMENAFSEELAQRYFELREDILSNESIMAEFEAFKAQIPALTFEREEERWIGYVDPARGRLPGEGYEQIQSYLETVSDGLDAKYSAWLAQ